MADYFTVWQAIIILHISLNLEQLPVSALNIWPPEIRDAEVITVEGNPHLAELASQNFRINRIKNITVINSSFDDVLPQLANYIKPGDLVYIDGNHTAEATWRYYYSFYGIRVKIQFSFLMILTGHMI